MVAGAYRMFFFLRLRVNPDVQFSDWLLYLAGVAVAWNDVRGHVTLVICINAGSRVAYVQASPSFNSRIHQLPS